MPSPDGDTINDSLLIARADRGRIVGSESAPIWIVMISDFQCPYCKQFHDAALPSVMRDYVATGKARFAYINLPLPQHPHARPAARAALCAGAQGKFEAYAEQVFAAQERLATATVSTPILDGIAKSVGLDRAEYARCIASPAIERLVQSDEQQASRAGVTSTPSFFVGEFLIQGMAPYPTFKTAVDSALRVAARKRSR